MNLAIIFGGKSDEHEVSRMSAVNVLNNLAHRDDKIFKIGITKAGAWFLTDAAPSEIEVGAWENHPGNRAVVFACDPKVQGILVFEGDGSATKVKIDCAIPILHGDFGEDGTIQGVFEMSGVPYVGPGVKASANSMDKTVTKIIAATTGVRQAEYAVVTKHEYNGAGREEALARADAVDGGCYPKFVKPAAAGSSVGATKVSAREELPKAIEYAHLFDSKALIEEMIEGRELEVAVLGNYEPKASSVGEILTAGDFYDYDSKYNNPDSKTRIPDDLPGSVTDEIRRLAVEIYKALDCRGMSRVDFFYSEEKGVVFNEINTIPGFTNISMYPELWRAAGVEGPELMDRLIEFAIEDHAEKNNFVRQQ